MDLDTATRLGGSVQFFVYDTIKILGSGCRTCHKLYETVLEAAKCLDTGASVEYITDMEQIMASGVMTLPALMIDGRVVSAGRVPKAAEIEKLLRG